MTSKTKNYKVKLTLINSNAINKRSITFYFKKKKQRRRQICEHCACTTEIVDSS